VDLRFGKRTASKGSRLARHIPRPCNWPIAVACWQTRSNLRIINSVLAISASPDLSIVIVNFNGGALLEPCVESLFAHPPSCAFEVVLVDNGSTDGSCERIVEGYPQLRVIRNQRNIGLSKAFNMGIRQAGGRYILSLDNDTRVLRGSLAALIRRMEESPRSGAVGGTLLNPDLTAQKTARRAPSPLNAVFGRRSILTRWFPHNPISRRYLMDDERSRSEPYEVDWLSMAALLVRREAIDQVGMLDERFFVYWVDADWCARIRKGGWRVEAVPAAPIIHDENLKSGRRTKRRTRMILDFHRGAYTYYRTHHARGRFNPMGIAALVALSTRAAGFVLWDSLSITVANLSKRRS
jgi:N-acetylglucosaminyl-diphospho-decaprenol L-rhamnosyltransferase